jgi:hypothetical protein
MCKARGINWAASGINRPFGELAADYSTLPFRGLWFSSVIWLTVLWIVAQGLPNAWQACRKAP